MAPIFSLLASLTGVGILLLLSGCASVPPVDIRHYSLNDSAVRFSDTILLRDRADDLREDSSSIGQTTWSVLAVPSGDVHTVSPLGVEVAQEVAQALASAGYSVKFVESFDNATSDHPRMDISIREFDFTNYTWLAPYIRTWGDITLDIALSDRRGTVVYEETFSGEGSSNCPDYGCGYVEAAGRAMTEILNQVIAASSNKSFRLAFEASPQRPISDVAAPPPMGTNADPERE